MKSLRSRKPTLARPSAALLLLALALGVIGLSGEPAVRAQTAGAADLALVPADATAFIHIRFADLWNSPLAQLIRQQVGAELAKAGHLAGITLPGLIEMEKETGLKLSDIDTINIIVLGVTGGEREPPVVGVVSTAQPYDGKKVVSAMKGNVQVRKHAGKSYHVSDGRSPAIHFAGDRMIVVADEPVLKRFLEGSAKPAGGRLAGALKLAGEKHHLVAGFQVPEPFLQMAKQESLPPEAAFLKPLLEVHSGSLVVDLTADIRVQATLNLPSDAAAKEAAEGLKKGLELAKQQIAQIPPGEARMGILALIAKQLENLLRETKVEPQRSSVVVTMQANGAVLLAALVPAVQKVRAGAQRAQGSNQLKLIGLAIHNYASDHNRLPPQAITDKAGKPLLSWRVAILPYLEHDDLYKQFKLDEPWDSAHNKKLLAKMPKVFVHPSAKLKDPTQTVYQGFAGKGTLFEPGQKLFFTQVLDGTSNTILVAEAAEGVPWTKPEDMGYDPKKPLPKLGGHSEGGFSVLWCDGSTDSIRKDFDEAMFRLAITRDDGIPFDRDKLVKP